MLRVLSLALPAALLGVLATDVRAQSSITAATLTRIDEARPMRASGLERSAMANAHKSQPGVPASYTSSITFVNPSSRSRMAWSSGVLFDSVGWFSEVCATQLPRKGIDPRNGKPYWHCQYFQSESPSWSFGTGSNAAGASGSMFVEDSHKFQATHPHEVRFRVLDHARLSVGRVAVASAQSRLEEGRSTTQANLSFAGPWSPAPGKPPCTADLVLDLYYGLDALHETDRSGSVFGERWLDLDIRYETHAAATQNAWGRIAIRAEGQPSSVPRGTGWPARLSDPRISQSTIHVQTSSGSRPPQTFNWNNGLVAGPGNPSQMFDNWTLQRIRVPLTLLAGQFTLDAVTHQRMYVGRSGPGATAVPIDSGLNFRGHGFDVRMYLDNLQPPQCRPDYKPPAPPPRWPTGGCTPTATTGCWHLGS